jgi:hypothetical protein
MNTKTRVRVSREDMRAIDDAIREMVRDPAIGEAGVEGVPKHKKVAFFLQQGIEAVNAGSKR